MDGGIVVCIYIGFVASVSVLQYILPWYGHLLLSFLLFPVYIYLYFTLDLKGSDLFVYAITFYFATLLTFGLALPWVIHREFSLIVNEIQVTGEIDFAVIQNREEKVTGTGDIASILIDVDLGF